MLINCKNGVRNFLLKQSSVFVHWLLFTYTARLFIYTTQSAYTYLPAIHSHKIQLLEEI